MRAASASAWAAALVVLAAAAAAAAGCGVAEFACRNARCVRLDQYCDGADNCGDASDEPAHCSVCNRTYYGEVGVAYALSAGGPGEAAPRVPFLCHLTFTAGGGSRGALVQLWLDEFRVGRYDAGSPEPCPDGFVQLAELGRPFTGGSWCGEAAGPAVYYSETATVTVSVKLFRARLGEPFALRMRYKFLAQHDAVVRFGPAAAPLERGAVSPGTYCTRTYEECHRKPCRLQSPNYPGMYPRNVTCYWSLRQKDIPTCKHAMISIRQDFAHKMQIKRSISMASLNKTRRVVRAWGACGGAGDRLLVYDGGSTDDPLLLEYCGGDWLPRVTARGPDMLVAFHSSPVAAPPRPAARGFELDVDVVFADSDSLEYAREPRRCEFHLKASSSEEDLETTTESRRGRRGILRAPAHTLPPNTTCSWTFHGRPDDLVWIYFASYSHYSLVDTKREESVGEAGPPATSGVARLRELLLATPPAPLAAPPPAPRVCPVALRVWDGGGEAEPGAELLGRFCSAPQLCARASLANATRSPRPCSPPDGYVSKGPIMSFLVTTLPGTATHPLSFSLHYEFIDAQLAGIPLPDAEHRIPPPEPKECARLIDKEGEFKSSRNVLWFGRGGAKRLRCIWRVDAGADRVALRILTSQFGQTPRCTTRADPHTNRPTCVRDPPDSYDREYLDHDVRPEEDIEEDAEAELRHPHLMIYESPWPGFRVPLACVCDNSSGVVSVVSGAGSLELELVGNLRADEDHRHVRFAATWSRTAAPNACAARRRLPPPGGHVALTFPYEGNYDSECAEAPFLLQARGNRSVFLRVWGEELSTSSLTVGDSPMCHTVNRVLVYEAISGRLVKVICPGAVGDDVRTVQVFSSEWWGRGESRSLLVRWAAREGGSAAFAWMEVWRSPAELAARLRPPEPTAAAAGNATEGECWRACPELAACVDPGVWCDGVADCPRGGDEAGACGAGARLLAALAGWRGAGAGAGAGAAAAAALLALLWARRRRGKPPLARHLTEDLLYDGSRASSGAS